MIRFPDLPHAALWNRPSLSAPRAEAHDASTWFRSDALVSDARLSGDLNPAARGLSVEQHAAQVLAHLCAEPDERA